MDSHARGEDFAESASRAAPEDQAQATRLGDLVRAHTLADVTAAALAPHNASGPEDLGRALGEAQRLVSEARQELATLIARKLAPGSTADEAGAIVRAFVAKACPPGSDERMRLGRALLQSAGGDPSSVPSKVLETAVAQALATLCSSPLFAAGRSR